MSCDGVNLDGVNLAMCSEVDSDGVGSSSPTMSPTSIPAKAPPVRHSWHSTSSNPMFVKRTLSDFAKTQQKHTPSSFQKNVMFIAEQHEKRTSKILSGYWINTPFADGFFLVMIVASAIIFGVSMELSLRGAVVGVTFWIFSSIEALFTVIFLVELILRICAEGPQYAITGFGALDTVVVFSSVADILFLVVKGDSPFPAVSVIRLFRALRLIRMVRLFSFCPELRILISGLLGTFEAAMSGMILVAVLCYGGALICSEKLAFSSVEGMQELHGSVGSSMLTHVKLAFGEAWPDIADIMILDNVGWAVYAVAFICTTNVALMSVVTAIICEQIVEVARRMPAPTTDSRDKDLSNYWKDIKPLFDEVSEGFPQIDEEQCLQLARHPRMRDVFDPLEIFLPIEEQQLLLTLNMSNAKKHITFKEFGEGLLRLRGTRNNGQSQCLQCDVFRCRNHILDCVQNAVCHVSERAQQSAVCASERLNKDAKFTREAVGLVYRGEVNKCADEIPPQIESACIDLDMQLFGLGATLSRIAAGSSQRQRKTSRKLSPENLSMAVQTESGAHRGYLSPEGWAQLQGVFRT